MEPPVLANRGDGSVGYDIERFTTGDYLRVGVCLKFSQTALVITAMKIK